MLLNAISIRDLEHQFSYQVLITYIFINRILPGATKLIWVQPDYSDLFHFTWGAHNVRINEALKEFCKQMKS